MKRPLGPFSRFGNAILFSGLWPSNDRRAGQRCGGIASLPCILRSYTHYPSWWRLLKISVYALMVCYIMSHGVGVAIAAEPPCTDPPAKGKEFAWPQGARVSVQIDSSFASIPDGFAAIFRSLENWNSAGMSNGNASGVTLDFDPFSPTTPILTIVRDVPWMIIGDPKFIGSPAATIWSFTTPNGLEAATIIVDPQVVDADTLTSYVAHEIGHTFGLEDLPPGSESGSLMEQGNPFDYSNKAGVPPGPSICDNRVVKQNGQYATPPQPPGPLSGNWHITWLDTPSVQVPRVGLEIDCRVTPCTCTYFAAGGVEFASLEDLPFSISVRQEGGLLYGTTNIVEPWGAISSTILTGQVVADGVGGELIGFELSTVRVVPTFQQGKIQKTFVVSGTGRVVQELLFLKIMEGARDDTVHAISIRNQCANADLWAQRQEYKVSGEFQATIVIDEPDTVITSSPPPISKSRSASFSFILNAAGSTFACSLDGAAFAGCTSPKSYEKLRGGNHNFKVRATDPAGNSDPTPASFDWTIDTVAPGTAISSGPPALSNNPVASFSFTSNDPNSTFECSVDGNVFASCASPWTSSTLADGKHTFLVRAIDAAGNADKKPAKFRWKIDATAPETMITRGPTNPTTSTSAAFSFTSSEKKSTFECNLDGAGFTACRNGQSYIGLTLGNHNFQVRAIDRAGNMDPSPASFNWTLQ